MQAGKSLKGASGLRPVKISGATDAHLAAVKRATRIPKQHGMEMAVSYWAPRVLSGEIPLVYTVAAVPRAEG